jgi:hypothetical protein
MLLRGAAGEGYGSNIRVVSCFLAGFDRGQLGLGRVEIP